MKTLVVVMIAAALAVGCSKDKTEAAPAPSVTAAASAPPVASVAAAAPSDSVAPLDTAAPSAAANVPTEAQYEQKAQAAISSTAAAEAELKKLEQEIGQ
jgi:flavin reductase (DIM6/NTAB) family NADH-FMN oxidoreductase RutF